MPGAKYSLVLDENEDFQKTLTYLAGSPAVPVDITGYTITFEVRSHHDQASTLLYSATLPILSAPAGTITFNIALSVIDAFTWNNAYYWVKAKSGTNITKVLLEGLVQVT